MARFACPSCTRDESGWHVSPARAALGMSQDGTFRLPELSSGKTKKGMPRLGCDGLVMIGQSLGHPDLPIYRAWIAFYGAI
ncbi:hypothetical protein TNCV_1643521 [Trichonephila clavipes]|nr:hypothetical protein TNCV_1643521 [Trichonephila clavipes]